MQNSQKTTQQSILHTQLSGEENPNKEPYSEVIVKEKVDNTPFDIVGNNEHGFCIALGRFRVTESIPWDDRNQISLQDLGIYLLDTYKWDIILNCMAIFQLNQEKEIGE